MPVTDDWVDKLLDEATGNPVDEIQGDTSDECYK